MTDGKVRWVGGRQRWSVRRDHRPLIYLLNRPLSGVAAPYNPVDHRLSFAPARPRLRPSSTKTPAGWGPDGRAARQPRGGYSPSRPPEGTSPGMNWLNWKESTSLVFPGRDEPVSEEEVVRRKDPKGPSPVFGSHAFPGAPGPGWRRGIMGFGDGDAGSDFSFTTYPPDVFWAPCAFPWCVPSLCLPPSLILCFAFPLPFASCRSPVTSRALLGINITHHQP